MWTMSVTVFTLIENYTIHTVLLLELMRDAEKTLI